MKTLFVFFIFSVVARGDVLIQKEATLPATAFNITFRVGSADDPKGKEGLVNLTALLLKEGGVKEWKGLPVRSRAELEEFLFPFAVSIQVSVHKEQVSFRMLSSAEDSTKVFDILSQVLLAPQFDAKEFARLKAETLDALEKQWPREDQEELGKFTLDRIVFGENHPYAHVSDGSIHAVKSLTLESVRECYQNLFVQKRLEIGIGGNVSDELAKKAQVFFKSFPVGKTDKALLPKVPSPTGFDLLVVKGPFEATGIHLGSPLSITRAHPDFPAMYLAATGFGKHRSFVGRLMKVVREIRGLNYGSYAYVEDFPEGGRRLIEPTQAARSQQAFTVWGRPTPLNNGCFLFRQLLREVEDLGKNGLTKDEFELGKGFLTGSIPLMALGMERKLGYEIDSLFYGIKGNYLSSLRETIEKLTLAQVNQTIKKHIKPKNLHLVVVTPDPEKFRKEIQSARCDIHYAAGVEKSKEVLEEDKKISVFKVSIPEKKNKGIESDKLFE